MFEPSAANWSWAFVAAPSPIPMTAITAPTPMIKPSMVRLDRILLRPNARSASTSADDKSIGSLILDRGHGLQYVARHVMNFHEIISPDLAIAKDDLAFRKLCDIRLVRNQNNGQPFRV